MRECAGSHKREYTHPHMHECGHSAGKLKMSDFTGRVRDIKKKCALHVVQAETDTGKRVSARAGVRVRVRVRVRARA